MSIRYRRFDVHEVEQVGKIFARVLNDLLIRAGGDPYVDVEIEQAWTHAWEHDRRSLFQHMTASDGESWLAERDGEIVGYARSVLRDGVCQLTDFFVLPGQQTSGIGKKLLDYTFSSESANSRVVISTTHASALARYLKSGVLPQCPIVEFEHVPEKVPVETGLMIERMSPSADTLATLNRIDRDVLGYQREPDHAWLLGDRVGYLYYRRGAPVGYGYVGRWCGPFALLEPQDFPAVLAHAESKAAAIGDELLLIVPLTNSTAVNHLLSRGFHMNDKFVMLFMADTPRVRLDHYIITSPGFFI